MNRFLPILVGLCCSCNVFLSLDDVEPSDADAGSTVADDGTIVPTDECSGRDSCALTCSEGGCIFECAGQSDCTASCSGGECVMLCEGNATCEFGCGGGGCTFSCAGACQTTCDGGGCSGP